MEAGGGGWRRASRETSPDRAKVTYMPRPRPITAAGMCRKAQIIYYLSRNGQLEHPHFMELPQLPNQHLRLKDVMDRLTVLRGRGMPSLYSWSCKRSYKNGYVWNDLAENDVIYPAYGAEYVLKGSEIIQDSSERFHQLQLSERRPRSLPIMQSSRLEAEEDEEIEGEVEEMEDEGKGGKRTAGADNSSYHAPYSRCSRGVSTDEIEAAEKPAKTRDRHHHHPTEIALDDASPPSSSSSEKAPANNAGGRSAQRYDDGDPEAEPGLTRNSVLLQLIACGSAATKGRKGGVATGGATSAASSPSSGSGRKSGSLHKGVLSRLATRAAEEEELNPQLVEKEYFSGSIVETITESSRAPAEPSLQKSSSYNHERSSRLGIGEVEPEVAEERGADGGGGGGGGGLTGKCIPGRKRASCKQQRQQQQLTTLD